jgi:hypothetical protein
VENLRDPGEPPSAGSHRIGGTDRLEAHANVGFVAGGLSKEALVAAR